MSTRQNPVLSTRARWLGAACAAVFSVSAWAQGTIKIGEINSYKAQPVLSLIHI